MKLESLTNHYPHDPDGDALRMVEAHGSDMSRPMVIEFFISLPDEESADRVATEVQNRGYSARAEPDSSTTHWTCRCSRKMIATYEAIRETQEELGMISAPHGGYADGWGTFGNE